MLKKLSLFVALCSVVLVYTNCMKKGCKPRSADKEAGEIQAYASANSITATQHSSGVYYQIIEPGTGAAPSATSSVVITYTGKFLNGETFDEMTTPNTGTPWLLTDLIKGWQYGLPLIKEGGRIRLIVPSSLGYGCDQYYSIPGNSILYFDITLVDVL